MIRSTLRLAGFMKYDVGDQQCSSIEQLTYTYLWWAASWEEPEDGALARRPTIRWYFGRSSADSR